MAAFAAVAALAGTGVQVYGQLKSAEDQAAAERRQEKLQNEQAAELYKRSLINEQIRDQATFRNKLNFGSIAAGTGHAGTGIGSQLEIQRQADQQTALIRHEVDYQTQMMKAGALVHGQNAENIKQAGYWGAAATILGGAGQAAGSYDKYAKSNAPNLG